MRRFTAGAALVPTTLEHVIRRYALETDDLSSASPALAVRTHVVCARPPDATLALTTAVDRLVGETVGLCVPSLIPVLRSAVATHGPFAFKYRQQLAARQEKRGGGGGVALGGSASTTFLAILDGLLLAPLRPRPGQPLPPERARGRAPEVAEACVLWALAWAFGSTLDARERRAFAVGLQAAAVSRSATIKPPLPAEGHLWDYCLDVARQRWLPWVDCLPERARKAARRPDDPILLPAPPPSVAKKVD